MNFYLVRQYIRFILRLYIKKITVTGNTPENGPVIFAGNHPNSFLDGIIIVCENKRAVWSTARGDAFKKPRAARFLDSIKIMPVFRGSEGLKSVTKNYSSFDKAAQILSSNSQIVIFSEGISQYQKEILPLKKGTARMVGEMWSNNDDLKVVPTFIAYNDFTDFGKNVILNFGEAISKNDFPDFENGPKFYNQFNKVLKPKLEGLLSYKFPKLPFFQNPIYYIGWLVNFPVYMIIRNIIRKKTKGTVFYDSSMIVGLAGGLFIYWLLIFVILGVVL